MCSCYFQHMRVFARDFKVGIAFYCYSSLFIPVLLLTDFNIVSSIRKTCLNELMLKETLKHDW